MSSSVGRNSLIMASGTAASRLTGQIRTILLAAAIGTTGLAANAYQAGSMIPQVVFTLVSGGIFNAVLVPQIVRTLKEDGAERRLNKLITFAIVLLLSITVLMSVASPVLTRLYTNSGPDMTALTNAFTLWCMPQILFYGLYTVTGQILAASNRFGMYAWSSVGANIISSIGFIAFIMLFGKADQQPLSFWTNDKLLLTAGAWTLGVAFQALILFLPLRKIGIRYRRVWGIKGIGLRSMGPVAAWSIGIVGVDQLAGIINTRIINSAPAVANAMFKLSEFDVAGNATYQNAYTLYILPYSLIAVSVSTAIFPKLSRAIADGNIAEARFDLSKALRNVGMLMCFFTVAFIVMPMPIILALLPSVSAHEASLISGPLIMLSVSLPLASAYLIIQRTFYAFEDGKRPFLFIVLQVDLQVLVLLIGQRFLSPVHWVDLLGASISIGYLLAFPVLVRMLRRRFDGHMDGRRIAMSYGKAGIASAAALVGGLWMKRPAYALVGNMPDSGGLGTRWLEAVTVCVILAITIAVLYVGVLWLLRSEELISLVRGFSERRAAHSTSQRTHRGTAAAPLHRAQDAPRTVPPQRSTDAPAPAESVSAAGEEVAEEAATELMTPIALSAIPTDRITGTSHAQTNALRQRVEGTMKPELGEIVVNRYTLMSLIREEPGLQVWKAHDRVLAHDCQLFLVNSTETLHQINDVASALVLSRNSHVTGVLQLRRHGDTMIIITELDHGISLTALLNTERRQPMGAELIRSILAQSSRTLQQLLFKGLRKPALSTDTIRLTTHGVELADIPISPLLADLSGAPANTSGEQLAIRQLSSVLYAMLTNTASQQLSDYSLEQLPAGTPDEFRLLCRRGLNLQESGRSTVPMVTLAEFIALLGEWKPLQRLDGLRSDFDLETQREPSIASVKINVQPASRPFDLDAEVLSTEAELAAREAAGTRGTPDGDEGNGPAATVPGASALGTADSYDDQESPSWSNLSRPAVDDSDDEEPKVGFRDIAAAEMAGIMSPTVPGNDDDLPFPEFPTLGGADASANAEPPTAKFDFSIAPTTVSPDHEPGEQHEAVEATGRIPVIDSNGRPVRPGEESLRALKAEQAQRDAALPPSFAPHAPGTDEQSEDNEANSDIANAPLFGGIKTKVIAIVVVAAVLVAALSLAIEGLTHHGDESLGQNGTSQWPTADLDNVPFGDQQRSTASSSSTPGTTASPSAKPSSSPSSPSKQAIVTADKHAQKVPAAKVPTNTTPFDVDKQEFLTNPGGQRGYGYYMHLSQPQNVYRFVVKIRSSGGKAYLRANTTADPTQGEQVAEFSFDASGTTDIKLTKQTKAQDFVMWVPIDSLPNNQLYINSVQFF